MVRFRGAQLPKQARNGRKTRMAQEFTRMRAINFNKTYLLRKIAKLQTTGREKYTNATVQN